MQHIVVTGQHLGRAYVTDCCDSQRAFLCCVALVQISFYMISPSAADIPPPTGVAVGRPFRLPTGYKTPVDLEEGVPHPTLVVQQVIYVDRCMNINQSIYVDKCMDINQSYCSGYNK